MLQNKKYISVVFFVIIFLQSANCFSGQSNPYNPSRYNLIIDFAHAVLDPNSYHTLQDLNTANAIIYDLVLDRNTLLAELEKAIYDYNRVVTDHNALYNDWVWAQAEIKRLKDKVRIATDSITSLTADKNRLKQKIDDVVYQCQKREAQREEQCQKREDQAAQRVAHRDAALRNVYGNELVDTFNAFEARVEAAEAKAKEQMLICAREVEKIERAMDNLIYDYEKKLKNWRAATFTATTIAVLALLGCWVSIIRYEEEKSQRPKILVRSGYCSSR